MQRTLCSTLIASLIASMAYAADTPAPVATPTAKQTALPSGVDAASIDSAVRAQDDFFRYSQGTWLNTVEIPADRSEWGAFSIAQENVQQQLRMIIEEAEHSKHATAGSDTQKVGDFYASFINEKARDALGLAPLKNELAGIAAITDKQALAALIAHFEQIGVTTPYRMTIHQDNKESTKYIVDLSQSGLGMPNRDYYLKLDDAKTADTRAKYQLHLEKLLTLAGHADAAAEALQILALETAIAKAQWSAVENRDPVKAYNKLTLTQLDALAPGQNWSAYLTAAGMSGKVEVINVSQPSFLSAYDTIVQATPLPVLKAYFEARLISSYAPYLSQAFVAENFAFRGGGE